MIIKKTIILTTSTIISILLFFIISESTLYFYFKRIPAESLFRSISNYYLEQWDSRNSCSFPESIISHPTLGFVHRKDLSQPSDCRMGHVNNIGLMTPDNLPIKKNKNEFRIFILGGSVAHHLSNYINEKTNNQRPYIENYLNKNYISPNGFPFVISTGATGSWTMPNPIIMTLMYSSRVDAIVDLEGYNEAFNIKDGNRFEQRFDAAVFIAGQSKHSLVFKYLYFLRKMRSFIKKFSLQSSYTFYSIYKINISIFSNYIVPKNVLDEFSYGDEEEIRLNILDKQNWILNLYEDYIIKLHNLAKISNLYSAQFLQPTRHIGKELTELEKSYSDQIELKEMLKIQTLYKKLERNNYPIRDLSYVFQDEKNSIYADHIHYIDTGGNSRGNEILSNAIADNLAKIWHLKRKSIKL